MNTEKFADMIGSEFYAGVPDSQLRSLCDYLMDAYGTNPRHHMIAANEGNCVALAAGYYMATGKIPVVYMQNSGEGNIVNPVTSLLHEKVYGIPVVFVIGWRGEPGTHDEPQHIYQGEITLRLLDDMGIRYFVIGKDTSVEQAKAAMNAFRPLLKEGKDVAFVIRKDALQYQKRSYGNSYSLSREKVIRHIVRVSGEDPVISTTGKASRELFEIRETNGQGHQYDFLTVGSMGHCGSIAFAIAAQKQNRKVWCIDGDGAVLMHMGSLAVNGAFPLPNLIHIVINNGAHETVGGMPTVALTRNLAAIAKACGYPYAISVNTLEALDNELNKAKHENQMRFIEVKCEISSRENLGRPTATTSENIRQFMNYLHQFPSFRTP